MAHLFKRGGAVSNFIRPYNISFRKGFLFSLPWLAWNSQRSFSLCLPMLELEAWATTLAGMMHSDHLPIFVTL